MLGKYTSPEGYEYIAYSAGFMDFGLAITKNDDIVFNSPCELSWDCYGFTPWDELESEELSTSINPEDREWDEKEWAYALEELYKDGSYHYHIEEYEEKNESN